MEEAKPENVPPIVQPELPKQSNKKSIVLVLVGLLAVVGSYLIYQKLITKSQIQEINYDSVSTTKDQVINTKKEENVSYIYLIKDGQIKLIGTTPAKTGETPQAIVSGFFDNDNGFYFIKRKWSLDPVKGYVGGDKYYLTLLSADGKQTDISEINLTFSDSDGGTVALSPNGLNFAHCGYRSATEYGPEIISLNKQTAVIYNAPNFCNKGSGGIWFSSDGNKVYSWKGFYEGPYEVTPEESRAINISAKNGYYELDLVTKEEKYLGYDAVSLKDRENGKNLQMNDKNIVIKDIGNIQYEVMVKSDYEKLPVIASISVPDQFVYNAKLTADGTGVYYVTNKPGSWPGTIGYYDIASKQNYYPIVSSDKRITLVNPLNKNNLYYTQSYANNEPTQLIKLSLDGTQKIINESKQITGLESNYMVYVVK